VRKSRPAKRSNSEALILEVLGEFRVIYGAVRGQHRDIQASCGISGAQLWLLREIEEHPNIGVSELARRLSIHQSTCSLLVEKLAAKRYIRRAKSDQDSRRVGLTLTKYGASCLDNAPGPAEGLLPKALSELRPSTLLMLQRDLRKVIEKLRVHDGRYAKKPLSDL
jgi:DNA-binding MarR family transcriptional regulator